jgi:hypothetical protein
MEVHHHPNIEKKGFKEYILEGLMIFLAVTLGFFAESIREKITDKEKERDYVLAMIEDAQTDTANIREAIRLNEKRSYYLDSLVNICNNYDISNSEDSTIYKLYREGLSHPSFISPTERTLLQLKNSGGMRLIRIKSAVDSIILYDDAAKKLIDQQAYYELYQNKSVDIAVQIFDFQYFNFRNSSTGQPNMKTYDKAKLITHDKMKLMELGNLVHLYQGVVNFYITRLHEMNDHAVHLINTLKMDYQIEND